MVNKETELVSKKTHCPVCGAFNSQAIQKERVEAIRKCSVIFLTGTPIKNSADEFYVPLNILDPAAFPSKSRFERDWLYRDDKSNKLRVHPYKLEEFKKVISKFMIRREKEDVYTDLPTITRNFTIVKIERRCFKRSL